MGNKMLSREKRVDARFKVKGDQIEIRLYKKELSQACYDNLVAQNYWMKLKDEREIIRNLFTGKVLQKIMYKCHLPLSDWLEAKRLSAYGYNLQSNLVKALLPVLEPITEPDHLQDVAIEVAWQLIKVMEKEESR